MHIQILFNRTIGNIMSKKSDALDGTATALAELATSLRILNTHIASGQSISEWSPRFIKTLERAAGYSSEHLETALQTLPSEKRDPMRSFIENKRIEMRVAESILYNMLTSNERPDLILSGELRHNDLTADGLAYLAYLDPDLVARASNIAIPLFKEKLPILVGKGETNQEVAHKLVNWVDEKRKSLRHEIIASTVLQHYFQSTGGDASFIKKDKVASVASISGISRKELQDSLKSYTKSLGIELDPDEKKAMMEFGKTLLSVADVKASKVRIATPDTDVSSVSTSASPKASSPVADSFDPMKKLAEIVTSLSQAEWQEIVGNVEKPRFGVADSKMKKPENEREFLETMAVLSPREFQAMFRQIEEKSPKKSSAELLPEKRPNTTPTFDPRKGRSSPGL